MLIIPIECYYCEASGVNVKKVIAIMSMSVIVK